MLTAAKNRFPMVQCLMRWSGAEASCFLLGSFEVRPGYDEAKYLVQHRAAWMPPVVSSWFTQTCGGLDRHQDEQARCDIQCEVEPAHGYPLTAIDLHSGAGGDFWGPSTASSCRCPQGNFRTGKPTGSLGFRCIQ